MSKPYLFLDVDGVINSLRTPTGPHTEHSVSCGINGTFSIQIRERVLEWLTDELPELAEVRWNTTWCSWANRLADTFGFPQAEVAAGHTECPDLFNLAPPWKYDALLSDWKKDPRPFVWVDDEAISSTSYRAAHDFSPFDRGDTPFLLVEPNGNWAISDDEIHRINTFLRSH